MPRTDVVWTHLFNRTGLPERFDARVIADLSDLMEILPVDARSST